ncbi:hypothetical protein chiPu_0016353 [Chiloscyllium punctatum]|uniref:Uncharacterized protein n=1 Tax=Chiloscyllium punctatum TaxID=137246 RepID=A0A401T5D7_CHIPU|nr:hypothetical protein [Chiloscyllium punctatum]
MGKYPCDSEFYNAEGEFKVPSVVRFFSGDFTVVEADWQVGDVWSRNGEGKRPRRCLGCFIPSGPEQGAREGTVCSVPAFCRDRASELQSIMTLSLSHLFQKK